MAGIEHPNPVILDVEGVRQTLESQIDREAGETCEVWQERPDFGIGGFVVRRAFRDMEVPQRQRWLRDLLCERFGEASDDIGHIAAFSPEEHAERLHDF